MKKPGFIHLITVLILSFCFVLPSWAQEKKEAEDVYTIKRGDTLWDISSKYLHDPFLWPKLWQTNPYITNPNRIYPGKPIRLSPLEDLKKEGQKEAVVEEKPKEVKTEEAKPKEEVVEAETKKAEPPPIEKKREVVTEAKPQESKPAEKKPDFFYESRSTGFLSDRGLQGIGVILDSKDGQNLMCAGDIVYVSFKTSKNVLKGDKYTIFRAEEEVRHPVTQKKVATKYRILGNLQIIDRYDKFFTARVIEAFDAILKGDMVQPYVKERMEAEEKK